MDHDHSGNSAADRLNGVQGELAFSVLAKAQALEQQGKSVIHLEIGQPDFRTPDAVTDAAIEALRGGKTRYTPTLGIPELRQAIAEYVTRTRNVEVGSHMVAVSPSPKTAIFMAIGLLVNPGDEVIYPDPGFPTYENAVKFFGGIPRALPAHEERHFSFDREEFKKLFSKKTKLIILNSPSNPTGALIPKEDLEIIAEAVRSSDCYVLTDEIYSRMLYDDHRYESIYSLPGMREKTFLIDGFSKSYSMTGWRLGYLIAPERFMDTLEVFAVNLFSCTATFTQYAGLAALKMDQAWVLKMVKEFQTRRDVLVEGLNSIPGITCEMPGGAFYAFPNIKKLGVSSATLADRLLEEAGVALLPGTAFGNHGEGYVRLSYANSLLNLEEAVRRIKGAVQKYS